MACSLTFILYIGPRGRILNHVETLRPARPAQAAPAQQLVETVDDTVDIPEPEAGAVIRPDNIGAPVLSHSALVIGREFEMMNIFLVCHAANECTTRHGVLTQWIPISRALNKPTGTRLWIPMATMLVLLLKKKALQSR